MNSILRPALVLFVALSLITGIAYPALVTAVGQAFFADQIDGSLVVRNGKLLGSSLIGQNFTDPSHFWGRASATAPMPYNSASSSGSNQGPNNPAFIDAVKARIDALQSADPANKQAVPVDLVTASASGLDPHISVAAAYYQAGRIASHRKMAVRDVQALINQHTQAQVFGFLGEPRVNVLALNMALDERRR